MYIRFNDTGETYKVTGERRQFWLFDKNGELGRAVKGSGSYTLIDTDRIDVTEVIESYEDIKIRDEIEEDIYDDMDFEPVDFDEENGDEDS